MFKLIRPILFLMLLVGNNALAQTAKPIVAVSRIEDLTGNNLSQALTTMIESSVAGTSKFRLMERQNLDRLVDEQGLAKGGMVTTNTPNTVGGFEGVDYLIYGTITSINVRTQSDIGANLFSSAITGNNNANCAQSVATLELDVRITNARTSEIKYVKRITEVARSQTNCGQRSSVDTGVLLRSAADKVASGLVTTIYPIQVAAVQGDGSLILNYGEGSLTVGQYLNVYSRGENILDPSSGEVIGTTESKLGMVRVLEVNGRISKATAVTTFTASPPVGSVLRPASEDDIRGNGSRGRRQ